MPSAAQSEPFRCRFRMHGSIRIPAILLMSIGLVAVSGMLHAFEELTEAQNLVYDTAHLSNTDAGQQVKYRYRSRTAPDDIVTDRVLLSIEKAHQDDRRDVTLDFLSAERHVAFPDFTAFRGNPVVIAMLEHIAQSFGRKTGGGVLYFRNRIRDALAKKSTRIEPVTVSYRSGTIDATRILLIPFFGDVYVAEKPEYTGAVFSITLSDEVPGGVVSVAVVSGKDGDTYFEHGIIIE